MLGKSNLFGNKEPINTLNSVAPITKGTAVYNSTQLKMISYFRINHKAKSELLSGLTLSMLYHVARRLGTPTEDIEDLFRNHGIAKSPKNTLPRTEFNSLLELWYFEMKHNLSDAEADYLAAHVFLMLLYSIDNKGEYNQARVAFEEIRHHYMFTFINKHLTQSHIDQAEVMFVGQDTNDIDFLRNVKFKDGVYKVTGIKASQL